MYAVLLPVDRTPNPALRFDSPVEMGERDPAPQSENPLNSTPESRSSSPRAPSTGRPNSLLLSEGHHD
ncbi:unnamed protein product [Heligmosomoides polygyrus]|uniref:Uncharacterized protein n=1 Tax=Heligmosomoides polygyrus TaxID=6339 RepID=A0A183GS60_HELPZ|nr:unnamed protein product [Heligmosomoides polygyrus]